MGQKREEAEGVRRWGFEKEGPRGGGFPKRGRMGGSWCLGRRGRRERKNGQGSKGAGDRALGYMRVIHNVSPVSGVVALAPVSGRLMEMTSAHLQLLRTQANSSQMPRLFPWQRRVTWAAPVEIRHGGGACPEVRQTGLLGDDSLSCRHLASSSYHRCGETTLTQNCSPTPRRTGSPERRSHAGRTCAGGASAAAGGHRAQTGTVPPSPRPAART